MNHSFLDRTLIKNNEKGTIREENITNITTITDINYISDMGDITNFKERLIRNFITYVKHTGDCNYLSLLNANKLESKKNEKIEMSKQEKILEKINKLLGDNKSELDIETGKKTEIETNIKTDIQTSEKEKILTKIDTNITQICLNLKDIIKQFAESLHPTNQSENIRNLLEDIGQPNQIPYLITALKEKHKKLARFLDLIITIAQKEGDQNLKQFINDLTYYAEYIKHHAQPTKIQHDLSQISDSFLYLRRLNQYLDLIPETVINLIDSMTNISE